ncbi:MAG: hypothetical protein WCF94_04130 [bacterium]
MIIFINGSINSGKTTVSKILMEKLGNFALIEIDSLCEMISWMPIDKAVPINWENAVSVIKNFSKHGISSIIPYPISQKNYDYVMAELKDLNENIMVFTLAPKLESALENRGTRELSDWEKERIKYHYEIGIPNPTFGEIIDNTDLTPEQTAEYIMEKINK